MAQNITRSVEDLVAEADAAVRKVGMTEALGMRGRDDVLFVDIRDVREVAKTGRIKGARHVPRGMLEFWIDPESPYHKPFFAEDKTFVFYCAGAWRSALAAKTAQDMGLGPVAHLEGGITAWIEADGPIDPPPERKESK
jgi:rhodanese-related sulfurtransferase